jgi:hypothetical protein
MVHFVDIGEIDDRHCIYFLFHNSGFEFGRSWVRVWWIVGSSVVDRGFECGISWVRVR